jgi:hypothetical protein
VLGGGLYVSGGGVGERDGDLHVSGVGWFLGLTELR